jgi:hypothetical protein
MTSLQPDWKPFALLLVDVPRDFCLYTFTFEWTIVGKIASPQPETRYKVGTEADQIPALRRKLSDREWDAIYRRWLNLAD